MIDSVQQLPPADTFKTAERQFRADVLRGLCAAKKALPCKYFYDEVGSALFEQITELEEYYPHAHRTWHHGAPRDRDGRTAGAALPTHRVWQWQ